MRRERRLEAASAGMGLLVAGLVGLTLAGSGPVGSPAVRQSTSRALAEVDRAFDALGAAAVDQAERALLSLHRFHPTMPAAPEPAPNASRVLEIAEGDTLADLLARAGAEAGEAQAAIHALKPLYDPRRLKIGQEVTLTFSEEAEARPRLLEVSLAASIEQTVVARLSEGGFAGEAVARPLTRAAAGFAADIDDSLYLSAQRAGTPVPVILELIRLYSYDIDFQRDLQPGDRIEALYETQLDSEGRLARTGEVLAAKFAVKGTELPIYRFRLPDGSVDWFDAAGESVRKALLKTPIDGARLSSGFGLRRHPILGYSRMHRGVDFAAPSGTPVMAAGDGVIERAGRNGGYGNYVRLRHDGRHRTAYAHLSRFAQGMRAGKRVKQGQVIGYVGTTGRSTGPHLHYEVLIADEQVNPMGLKFPTGRKLEGKLLADFQRVRADLDRRLDRAVDLTRTAALQE